MRVTEPGDWIRVVTASSGAQSMPEPATMILLGIGLGSVGAVALKKRQRNKKVVS